MPENPLYYAIDLGRYVYADELEPEPETSDEDEPDEELAYCVCSKCVAERMGGSSTW